MQPVDAPPAAPEKPAVCNRSRASEISATLKAWANHLGKHYETLERSLREAGVEWTPGEPIAARDVLRAMCGGDELAEKIRNLKADADRKEREEREANRELVRFEEVERVLTEFVLTPLATRLNDLRLTKPDMANWVDETMKIVREGLPKQ